jgi:hypothetical protein
MSFENEPGSEPIDPAAVLGAAVSLWQACQRDPRPDLSAYYGGGDQWMREVMRVATLFETWATRHVCFDECWPYFLDDRFGGTCVGLVGADGLARFEEADCLRVALRVRRAVGPACGLRRRVSRCTAVRGWGPFAGRTARGGRRRHRRRVSDGRIRGKGYRLAHGTRDLP